MSQIRIGIIREGKVPTDARVPMTPKQCQQVMEAYPEVDIVVQYSEVRKIRSELYIEKGVKMTDDLDDRDILLGVKEVPINMLIPNKTYFFFSHTIKMQPYNRDLLRAILEKNIRLIDYELLTDSRGHRVIAFGRYAGVVGAYNGLRAFGEQSGRYHLRPAHQCEDREEMEAELTSLELPKGFKIAITGNGRVGKGALEILKAAGIKEVSVNDFIHEEFDHPVYTLLEVTNYYKRKDGGPSDRQEIFSNPEPYESDFMRFAKVADLYIACHFWDSRAPFIFSRDDMKDPDWNIKVVADVSCDIDGPVACTLRPSTVEAPFYAYHRFEETETHIDDPDGVMVMAVDNLPCELPKDSSQDFGHEFIKHVLPQIIEDDPQKMLERATIARDGKLTQRYEYLQDYVDGKVPQE